MAWALGLDAPQRAAKMPLSFEVLRGIPLPATVTAGNDSEHQQFRVMLQAGRLSCMDRGYAEYLLFQQIIDAQSSFIGRIRANAVGKVVEERSLSAAALAAGVRSDRVVWLGCAQSGAVLKQSLRVVEVPTGKLDARGGAEVLLLATDRMDLDAELVAIGYK